MNDDEKKRKIAKLGGRGILFSSDLDSLNLSRLQILELMSDQGWHSRSEIISAANGQTEGLRRMRELRDLRSVDRIERARESDRREFIYRLVFREPGEFKTFEDDGEAQRSLW